MKKKPMEQTEPEPSKNFIYDPLIAFTNMIQWLYERDNAFESKNEWREEFVKKLRKELGLSLK
jgi:hypothetical protein